MDFCLWDFAMFYIVLTFANCKLSGPKVIKLFFMLNLVEHEIFSADKYENANLC